MITLSEPDRLYEAGTPIPLTATLFNPSDRPVVVGQGITGGEALELLDSRSRVTEPNPGIASPGNRRTLAPKGRLKLNIDPGRLLPALAVPGLYNLTVVYPRFRSNSISLRIVPAFSPRLDYRATVETDAGTFTLGFFPDSAPGHVRNFVNLARTGFYDKTPFHRIVPDLLIQGGDPTGTGTGGPGYTIPAEFNDRPHRAGTLSMARGPSPHSAGSQWFICLRRVPEWDGKYTVFGEVVAGMEVVRKIGRSEVKDEVPLNPVWVKQISISEQAKKTPPAH